MMPFFIYFCFQIFYKTYKEFLVYLTNLTINEKSEKFWYGVDGKVSMGNMGKCWRRDIRVVRNCCGRCEEMWGEV